MAFSEFAYQLLQARDFEHLHTHTGCTLQIGGSDQYGNIVAGLDLIHRLHPEGRSPAFGLTTPLLTTAAGAKFGKSAGNAVWLDARATPAYDLWQFFYRTPDADVGRFLRMFTLVPLDAIRALEAEHAAAPERRLARTDRAAPPGGRRHAPRARRPRCAPLRHGHENLLRTRPRLAPRGRRARRAFGRPAPCAGVTRGDAWRGVHPHRIYAWVGQVRQYVLLPLVIDTC
jgi:hypothetical protein